ncbi:MAG: hypothetical protein JWQ04_2720, partial [Pedosphaera sp.]|nr:hypothetical protein [Pedosphaera sp.]
MTILPVVERELRVASRRRGTYWTRSTVALVAMLIGAFAMLLNFGAPQAKLGSYIFIGLASFSVLHCLLAGRLATADCLSEEKREGTLGLLFLTDLKGYDVVLGKLVATSLNSFYGLLAIVPVLAIPLLLGGVTNGQFWRTVLVLVNTFLFSLAVGMFCSAVSRDIRKTMGLNFGLMFFFTAILPGCAAVIAFNSPGHFFSQELCFTSPLYGFFWAGIAPFLPPMVLGKVMTTPPVQFWQSLAVIHGLSWLFLLLAARIAPRSWQDRPAPPVRTGKARVRELWHAWSYGSPAKRPAFRKRLLDLNAFYWHAARARLKPLHVWIFFGLMGVWWLWGRIVSGTVWLDESVNLTMALMLNTTFKLWVAAEAGQRLAEDQKIGALELVLSTPLGVRDILRGQLLALRRQFLLPVLVAIGMEFFLMHASVAHANRPNSTTYAFWLAGIFMLPMDLAALIWVSMARGLTAKSYNRALIGTVYCILVLPWLAYLLTLGLIALWFEGWLGLNWEPSQGFHLGTWLAAALAADLGFGLRARWLLQHRLRELAMQRLALPPPRAPKSPPRRKRDEKPAPIVELQSSFRNIEQPTSNIEHRMPDLRHSEPKVQSAILSVSASPEETPAMAALPLSQFDVQRSMFDVRCSRNSF